MSKFAIILQAGPGTHESHARMLHSMVYSKELQEGGHEVRLIFDGAATEWLAKWGDPQDGDDRGMGGFFSQLKDAGVPYAVCDFCAQRLQGARAAEIDERTTRVGIPRPSEHRRARQSRFSTPGDLTVASAYFIYGGFGCVVWAWVNLGHGVGRRFREPPVLRLATAASRSSTSICMRFHPPGAGAAPRNCTSGSTVSSPAGHSGPPRPSRAP